MGMKMILKDGTTFDLDEIVYRPFDNEEVCYNIRVSCEDSNDIQQLFYNLESSFTPDNISKVIVKFEDGKSDSVFNFNKLLRVFLQILDEIIVLEVSVI